MIEAFAVGCCGLPDAAWFACSGAPKVCLSCGLETGQDGSSALAALSGTPRAGVRRAPQSKFQMSIEGGRLHSVVLCAVITFHTRLAPAAPRTAVRPLAGGCRKYVAEFMKPVAMTRRKGVNPRPHQSSQGQHRSSLLTRFFRSPTKPLRTRHVSPSKPTGLGSVKTHAATLGADAHRNAHARLAIDEFCRSGQSVLSTG